MEIELSPVLSAEEYIEQAYFFRTFRERLADGRTTQEVLDHIHVELLSTTRLPIAVQFMLTEMKHSGVLHSALEKLPHYFTPLQTHIISCAEDDASKLTFAQALLILQREAEYRAGTPSVQGLFVYQLECLSRNRIGYVEGLGAMQCDAFYDDDWRDYLDVVSRQLGLRDFAELVYARSQYHVIQKQRLEPDYQPGFPVLFSEKEGQIAFANIGKDPMYLFATLQRQLGYPEVPRPPRSEKQKDLVHELEQRIKTLETRLEFLEGEVRGGFDLSKYYVKKPD